MLPSSSVLSRLVGRVYDAAADAALWEVFLQDLVDVAKGNCAVMVVHGKLGDGQMTGHVGFDPAQLQLYNAHFNRHDIWAVRAWPLIASQPFFVSEALIPSPELKRTLIYNDWMRSCDIGRAMFGVLEHGPQRTSNITITRPLKKKPFRNDDLDLVRFLAPHLRRAFRIHFELVSLKHNNKQFEAALNAVSAGVFFLDENGRVMFMNRAASEATNYRDGLSVIGGRLCATDARGGADLERLIREATRTSAGKGLSAGGALLIERNEKPPLQVTISPVRELPMPCPGRVAAIVFVSDPVHCQRGCNDLLTTLFGLTPAECRLALLLGDGKSLPQVSEMLKVSINTIKTQLASIYAKTGTSRQSQLVRLIAQMPGPIVSS